MSTLKPEQVKEMFETMLKEIDIKMANLNTQRANLSDMQCKVGKEHKDLVAQRLKLIQLRDDLSLVVTESQQQKKPDMDGMLYFLFCLKGHAELSLIPNPDAEVIKGCSCLRKIVAAPTRFAFDDFLDKNSLRNLLEVIEPLKGLPNEPYEVDIVLNQHGSHYPAKKVQWEEEVKEAARLLRAKQQLPNTPCFCQISLKGHMALNEIQNPTPEVQRLKRLTKKNVSAPTEAALRIFLNNFTEIVETNTRFVTCPADDKIDVVLDKHGFYTLKQGSNPSEWFNEIKEVDDFLKKLNEENVYQVMFKGCRDLSQVAPEAKKEADALALHLVKYIQASSLLILGEFLASYDVRELLEPGFPIILNDPPKNFMVDGTLDKNGVYFSRAGAAPACWLRHITEAADFLQKLRDKDSMLHYVLYLKGHTQLLHYTRLYGDHSADKLAWQLVKVIHAPSVESFIKFHSDNNLANVIGQSGVGRASVADIVLEDDGRVWKLLQGTLPSVWGEEVHRAEIVLQELGKKIDPKVS